MRDSHGKWSQKSTRPIKLLLARDMLNLCALEGLPGSPDIAMAKADCCAIARGERGARKGSLIWKAAEHPREYLLHPSRACTQEPRLTSARGQSLPVCLASRKHIVQKCVLLGIGGRCRSLLSRASTSIHEHLARFAGRNRSWANGRSRASTSILRAAHAGTAHVSMGEHEHPRTSSALHR